MKVARLRFVARQLICFKVYQIVATAGANARQEGVGSCGRDRGLLQEPALATWSHQVGRAGSRQGGPEEKFLKFDHL